MEDPVRYVVQFDYRAVQEVGQELTARVREVLESLRQEVPLRLQLKDRVLVSGRLRGSPRAERIRVVVSWEEEPKAMATFLNGWCFPCENEIGGKSQRQLNAVLDKSGQESRETDHGGLDSRDYTRFRYGAFALTPGGTG